MMYIRNALQHNYLPWDRLNFHLLGARVMDYVNEHKNTLLISHGTVCSGLFLFSAVYEMPLGLRLPILIGSGLNIAVNVIVCGLTRPNGFMPGENVEDTEYVEAAAYGMA